MTVNSTNEEQDVKNYFGKKVVREHCPLTGLKCCCERHICKAKKYQSPSERIKNRIQSSALIIPKVPFDGQSLHKISYIPFEPPKKDYITKPPDGIYLSKGNFETHTTHASSFKHIEPVPIVRPIQPCTRDILGPLQPLQDNTNYRNDFGPPPFSKRPTFKIKSNLFCENAPINDKTTNNSTYIPPAANFLPAKCFKPENYFSQYCKDPISDSTNYKLNFIKYKIPEKTDTSSWSFKVPYSLPKVPMDCTSLYQQTFKPLQPKSIKQEFPPCKLSTRHDKSIHQSNFSDKYIKSRNTITSDNKFYDESIYASDFSGKNVKPDVIDKRAHTRTSIHFGNGKFDGQSMNNLAYKAWDEAKLRTPKKLSYSSTLRQFGPMDLTTTNKHDYSAQPYSKRSLKDLAKSVSTESTTYKPLDCRTTSSVSYPPQIIIKRPLIVKPKPVLVPSIDSFDGDTLYKKSFLPWETLQVKHTSPESFTSFKIGAPFYGDTTYRKAFGIPERIVDEDCEKPCGCEYPTQCLDIAK